MSSRFGVHAPTILPKAELPQELVVLTFLNDSFLFLFLLNSSNEIYRIMLFTVTQIEL